MGCKFGSSVVLLSGGSRNFQPHIRTQFFFEYCSWLQTYTGTGLWPRLRNCKWQTVQWSLHRIRYVVLAICLRMHWPTLTYGVGTGASLCLAIWVGMLLHSILSCAIAILQWFPSFWLCSMFSCCQSIFWVVFLFAMFHECMHPGVSLGILSCHPLYVTKKLHLFLDYELKDGVLESKCWRILSFLILCSRVTPMIFLRHIISKTERWDSSSFFRVQVSAPYKRMDSKRTLYSSILVVWVSFAVHIGWSLWAAHSALAQLIIIYVEWSLKRRPHEAKSSRQKKGLYYQLPVINVRSFHL